MVPFYPKICIEIVISTNPKVPEYPPPCMQIKASANTKTWMARSVQFKKIILLSRGGGYSGTFGFVEITILGQILGQKGTTLRHVRHVITLFKDLNVILTIEI